MTGLLLGVFGFFGLHDLLWLQRALVGKLRGEFGARTARRARTCAASAACRSGCTSRS